MPAADNPLAKSGEPVTWNFKLLSQNDLGGFGGMGEGMSVQIAKDGRRIIWLAHESAPKNFTAVDVSDPRKPKVVVQTDLPQPYMRSNSLELSGDIMAVAYQTRTPGHRAAGAHDFEPAHPLDDQFYRCVDVRNPSKPVEVGRWWMPGTRKGETPLPRHALDKGYRAHNTNVYPRRGDRLYLCYIDGGVFVMDISDKSRPRPVSHWSNSPPYTGFTHTAVPFFDRGLIIVTDESTEDGAVDWPKLIWILDAREETNLVPIATCPMPPVEAYKKRGGRFGAHNIHENPPVPTAWQSQDIVFGTFFNGGLRGYDISNPYQPKEVATFVPPAPRGTPVGAVQLNDVFVDERGIVYTVDRHTGGLYVLEMDF